MQENNALHTFVKKPFEDFDTSARIVEEMCGTLGILRPGNSLLRTDIDSSDAFDIPGYVIAEPHREVDVHHLDAGCVENVRETKPKVVVVSSMDENVETMRRVIDFGYVFMAYKENNGFFVRDDIAGKIHLQSVFKKRPELLFG